MDLMEDDTKDFLKRIVWTVSSGLAWLFFTLGLGAYNGWMVPEHGIRTANIIFYVWAAISTTALIWFNLRIWKKKFPHG